MTEPRKTPEEIGDSIILTHNKHSKQPVYGQAGADLANDIAKAIEAERNAVIRRRASVIAYPFPSDRVQKLMIEKSEIDPDIKNVKFAFRTGISLALYLIEGWIKNPHKEKDHKRFVCKE